MGINFFNTYIDSNAFDRVKSVLDSTFLSEGELVKEFEKQLAARLNLSNPVAVNSGTSALHLALVLAGVKQGDEVICPAQTFVATATVILQQGAVPIFADIDYETGNISPASIKEKISDKTKVIIVVDWGGNPCDLDEIKAIAEEHGLKIVEDAAHAFGASYKGRTIGTISDFTCFSFQAIKHLTTGDGGAVCMLAKDIVEEARALRWFGISRENSQPSILGEREYDITKLGFKYHLNDYAAALGLANLENFTERLARRRAIAARYRQALVGLSGVTLFRQDNDRENAYWLFGFHAERREDFIRVLKERGVPTSAVHLGIDHNTIFGGKKMNLINQRKFDQTQINIPLHDGLSDENVSHIINSIKAGW